MTSNRSIEMDAHEEMVRILAALLRHQVRNQSEAIEELGKVGFGRTRISELLGTTPNTVNQALIAAKKRSSRKSTGQDSKDDGQSTDT